MMGSVRLWHGGEQLFDRKAREQARSIQLGNLFAHVGAVHAQQAQRVHGRVYQCAHKLDHFGFRHKILRFLAGFKGSSLICVHPTRSARAQNKAEGGGNEMAPHQDTQTRSRLSIGEDGPSDSALAAARDGRLRRPAAKRHAARCASRVLCSGGAPWRYSPSTVGDPFKDTSSVAMNPVIKFTTLFGLLAVELAITLDRGVSLMLAAVFFAISLVFVWRSFYGMRITAREATRPPQQKTI